MDGITDSMDVSLSKCGEMVKDRKAWRTAVHGVAKSRTRLSDSTALARDAGCTSGPSWTTSCRCSDAPSRARIMDQKQRAPEGEATDFGERERGVFSGVREASLRSCGLSPSCSWLLNS